MTARVHPAPLAATRSGSVVRSWTALTCRLRGGAGGPPPAPPASRSALQLRRTGVTRVYWGLDTQK